jgi:hypothetical protein
MKKIKLFLLFVVVITVAGIIYSCGCPDCYENEVIIRADTMHKQIKIEKSTILNVQIGAFLNSQNADKFSGNAEKILNMKLSVKVFSDGLYRVITNEFSELKKAEEVLQFVKSNGYLDAIIRDEIGPIN